MKKNDPIDMCKCIGIAFFVAVFLPMLLAKPSVADGAAKKPDRIVSLNLCADQILMMLVPKERIAAVSYLAQRPEASVMYQEARTIPVTTGGAEDVVLLKPDLVIVGTYTTQATVQLLRKLGANLIEVPPANGFDDIFKNIRTIAQAVGEVERAEEMLTKLRADLAKLAQMKFSDRLVMAPLYANGYSVGKQTLVDGVLWRAGYKSLGRKLDFSGLRKVSLETLVVEQPDALLLGHKSYPGDGLAHEIFRHPVLRHLTKTAQTLSISDAFTICGTPHTVEAVRQLRRFLKDAHRLHQGHMNLVQKGVQREVE